MEVKKFARQLILIVGARLVTDLAMIGLKTLIEKTAEERRK